MANFDEEKAEAQRRFDALPNTLKKEILAEKNVQLILAICQEYSIPNDKVKYVTMLIGEIFLGYIKPEELGRELHIYFDIDAQTSNYIEIEFKQKIFNGLKNELDKIYNPIKIQTTPEKEVPPTAIETEKEVASPANIPLMNTGKPAMFNTKQPIPASTPANPASVPQENTEQSPFIIHTKAEPMKPAFSQLSKEAPSLNLKVDPSIIQKTPVIKPISVRLEAMQPIQEKKFQMPVSATQPTARPSEANVKQETSTPLAKITSSAPVSEALKTNVSRPSVEISIPIQQKNIPASPIPGATLSLKQMSEQKVTEPETPKVVHYSNFKTDLTHLGTPKKPEPSKEDFINLSTFTKVSGNTVDLRSKPSSN